MCVAPIHQSLLIVLVICWLTPYQHPILHSMKLVCHDYDHYSLLVYIYTLYCMHILFILFQECIGMTCILILSSISLLFDVCLILGTHCSTNLQLCSFFFCHFILFFIYIYHCCSTTSSCSYFFLFLCI